MAEEQVAAALRGRKLFETLDQDILTLLGKMEGILIAAPNRRLRYLEAERMERLLERASERFMKERHRLSVIDW